MSDDELTGQFDARVWAREFVKTVRERPEIATDEATMIGWFANAIMAGYDHARRDLERRHGAADCKHGFHVINTACANCGKVLEEKGPWQTVRYDR